VKKRTHALYNTVYIRGPERDIMAIARFPEGPVRWRLLAAALLRRGREELGIPRGKGVGISFIEFFADPGTCDFGIGRGADYYSRENKAKLQQIKLVFAGEPVLPKFQIWVWDEMSLTFKKHRDTIEEKL